eukprot:9053752-Alexandrium_andersonii.AAC.1
MAAMTVGRALGWRWAATAPDRSRPSVRGTNVPSPAVPSSSRSLRRSSATIAPTACPTRIP